MTPRSLTTGTGCCPRDTIACRRHLPGGIVDRVDVHESKELRYAEIAARPRILPGPCSKLGRQRCLQQYSNRVQWDDGPARYFCVRPLVFLGVWSYSIYMLHIPTRLILDLAVRSRVDARLYFLAVLAFTILVGILTYYLFEMPIRQVLTKRRSAVTSAAVVLLAGRMALSDVESQKTRLMPVITQVYRQPSGRMACYRLFAAITPARLPLMGYNDSA
jgi:hypothetical protein